LKSQGPFLLKTDIGIRWSSLHNDEVTSQYARRAREPRDYVRWVHRYKQPANQQHSPQRHGDTEANVESELESPGSTAMIHT
jgi:hypothetical protein